MYINQLIKDYFSENIITKLVQDETGKRQYYRPVYSIHKWWARRPGALFRAIILLATHRNSKKQIFKSDYPQLLFHDENNSDISTDSLFFSNHNLDNTIVFDPFMGGGTTLVEANRMGAKVIGCDLNPVSYWIVRETLKDIDLKKLKSYFLSLERDAGERIKSLYKTKCIRCGKESDILYAFWVKYVECPSCSRRVHLFKRYFLNKGKKRTKGISPENPADVICPSCHSLNQFTGGKTCKCSICETEFNPKEGVYNKGLFSCLHHPEEKFSLIDTLKKGSSLGDKLVAIEYYCTDCKERLYKSPDDKDLEIIKDVQKKFEDEKENLLFPKQYIPKGATSARWIAHNFRQYHQVFNARQIIAFNYLFSAINKIPEQEYRNAFITIFSNSLEYNNMMTPYNYPHRKLHHLFNYHALPLTTTPVENCVWGSSNRGAGTFVNCYKRYVRAKKYCKQPFDKFKDKDSKIRTISSSSEKIQGKFVSEYNELKKTDKGVWLHCGDSSHLPNIPDKSVDFVITDPPYFDNIHYSELSNFFYVWIRLFQSKSYFEPEHVPTEQEAIVNTGMDKTEEDYYHLIKSVFSECNRVLKDDGLMMFTFHHSKTRAWWTILRTIIDSNFIIVDYFPVNSEYKVNPHVRGKSAIDTDLVIVCKKRKLMNDKVQFSFDTIVSQASKKISSLNCKEPEESKLYFYYIGEMLRVGSQSKDVRLEDFENLFDKSEVFIKTSK